MEEKTLQLLSVDEAAKKIKNLLKALSQINGSKCTLSIRQIKMIMKGMGCEQKIYVTKMWGHVCFDEPKEVQYIGIRIQRWFDEDEFIINIF